MKKEKRIALARKYIDHYRNEMNDAVANHDAGKAYMELKDIAERTKGSKTMIDAEITLALAGGDIGRKITLVAGCVVAIIAGAIWGLQRLLGKEPDSITIPPVAMISGIICAAAGYVSKKIFDKRNEKELSGYAADFDNVLADVDSHTLKIRQERAIELHKSSVAHEAMLKHPELLQAFRDAVAQKKHDLESMKSISITTASNDGYITVSKRRDQTKNTA